MGTNTVQKTGSQGRKDELQIPPHYFEFIRDKGSPLYDPRIELPIDEDMVVDVLERGVQETVSARRNGVHPEDGRDRLEIIKGRQRVRWALEANRRLEAEGSDRRILVPTKLVRGTDLDLYISLVVENEGRTETPPSMRAIQAQKLIDLGLDEERVAKVFRVTVTALKNTILPLLDLDAKVRQRIDAGEFSAALAATELVKLDRATQVEEMEKLIASGVRGEIAKTMIREKVKNGAAPAAGKGKKKATAPAEPVEAVKRRRTRLQVERFEEAVKVRHSKAAEVARAMSKWFLGSDRALSKFPELAEIAKEI